MAGKLDIRAQGKELADEMNISVVPLVSRPAAATAEPRPTGPQADAVPSPTPPPLNAIPRSTSSHRSSPAGGREAGKGVLDGLAHDSVPLVALNSRIPGWLSKYLDNAVLEVKLSGRKIKKEDVVEAALMKYFGLDGPV